MSAVDSLNRQQFGKDDWLSTVLEPNGSLMSGLREKEALRGLRRDNRVQQAKEANTGYCRGCGVHQPLNPTALCDPCHAAVTNV